MGVLYKRTEADEEISRFIRSYHIADCLHGDFEIASPPTGYPVLGHVFRGFEAAKVDEELQRAPPMPFNILAAPLYRTNASVIWSGGIGHIAAELTATCIWELFHVDVQALSNSAQPVFAFHPNIDESLNEAFANVGPNVEGFDLALKPFMSKARKAPDVVTEALHQIEKANGVIRIGKVCEDLNITLPTLNKWFRKVVGLPPKYFARVVQFNCVGRLILDGDTVSVAQLAADAGFSDQAHFCHACQEFVFKSPRRFLDSDYSSIATFIRQGGN